ncbi:unnamed protein product [Arctia plantaginis]|uniref:Uncharacterized protein n=12 Tax=Obtectomera TaxID=104431 RepID=A0A8S1A663_ARCPL|nr:unnamed protein product [Arctia plantaginis]
MARNAEKAMTTLARWRAAQVQEAGGQRERRPYLASECNDLPQAEKWRLQIVREIAKKVAQIQNDASESPVNPINNDELPTVEDVVDVVIDTVLPETEPLTLSPEEVFSKVANDVSPIFASSQSPIKLPSLSPSVKSEQASTKDATQYKSGSLSLGSQKTTHSNPTSEKSEGSFSNSSKLPSKRNSKSSKDDSVVKAIAELQPQGKIISDHVDKLSDAVKILAHDVKVSQANSVPHNIDKIAKMSKELTSEAKALRDSIKCLSEDITRTKQELCCCVTEEDVNFPYHLFLIEIIINKIHMKCECFDIDSNNLVIAATFLGKQPIILYDSSCGKIDNFNKLNVGKSTLFAMTYDKICSIKKFEIVLLLTKQPPCSPCVTKIGETHMDYTCEFVTLREELCSKWRDQQPTDNILCTTSTPLSKNMYYLSCCMGENTDTIGIIEVTVRMSFLGKEITTAFCAQPKPQGTSFLLKDDHGMSMYSCQRVEMDDHGKILLEEGVMSKTTPPCLTSSPRHNNPHSSVSSSISKRSYEPPSQVNHGMARYDEIYTKMNVNELKIRVPKSSKVERTGKYDKIQELCSCESTAYNTGEQIQFELPKDCTYPEKTYTSNLKYTLKGLDRNEKKDRKLINVTPTNCPVPVDMSKMLHPQKDVFILKIGKKLETQDKKTDLEIELVTPKLPSANENNKNISAQCSNADVKKPLKPRKEKSKDRKGKGAGLGEFRIRDLNDEINKLMREKRHWEVQIKALGGPDHARVGPKMLDQDGKEVPGNRGYKYFGAAKDLPGVRELFEQEPPPPPRRTRADLMRDVDADYYGYRDDDDGLLMPLEQEAEKEAIANAVDEWKRNKEENKDQDLSDEENIYPEDPDDKRIEDEEAEPVRQVVTSHVAVPSQKDIEEALLRRKKQELLEKYGCMDVDVKLEQS